MRRHPLIVLYRIATVINSLVHLILSTRKRQRATKGTTTPFTRLDVFPVPESCPAWQCTRASRQMEERLTVEQSGLSTQPSSIPKVSV